MRAPTGRSAEPRNLLLAERIRVRATNILTCSGFPNGWVDVSGLPNAPHTAIHSMAIAHNILYVATDGDVRTFNGATWTDVNGNLANDELGSMASNPTNPDIVYGTRSGYWHRHLQRHRDLATDRCGTGGEPPSTRERSRSTPTTPAFSTRSSTQAQAGARVFTDQRRVAEVHQRRLKVGGCRGSRQPGLRQDGRQDCKWPGRRQSVVALLWGSLGSQVFRRRSSLWHRAPESPVA